jgi:HEAT repeat protein
VAAFDDIWLIVDFTAPSTDPTFVAVLGAAARSVRQIQPGEERVDPFSASLIASRLVDDFDHVSALLRNQGPAGEDAVAGLLRSKDGPTRLKAMELLKDIATERSLPALRRAAKDADPVIAGMAQEIVQRLRPGDDLPPATSPFSTPRR